MGKKMIYSHPRLSAFVDDDLRAGIAGLAHYKPNGLCLEFSSTVLFTSCHSHIVNKSFEHAIERCSTLKRVVNIINDPAVLFNKPVIVQEYDTKNSLVIFI